MMALILSYLYLHEKRIPGKFADRVLVEPAFHICFFQVDVSIYRIFTRSCQHFCNLLPTFHGYIYTQPYSGCYWLISILFKLPGHITNIISSSVQIHKGRFVYRIINTIPVFNCRRFQRIFLRCLLVVPVFSVFRLPRSTTVHFIGCCSLLSKKMAEGNP